MVSAAPVQLDLDFAKSSEVLLELWRQAITVSEPESLLANRFVNSLDEMTKIQESRLESAQYYVPNAVLLMLLGVAIIAVGFTGYQSATQRHLHVATLMMAVTIAVVIVLVVDLDQPARGFIRGPPKHFLTWPRRLGDSASRVPRIVGR